MINKIYFTILDFIIKMIIDPRLVFQILKKISI